MKDKINEFEADLSVIPSGLTWILQPDISINKVFKESLRSKYVGYWIDKNNIKVSKSTIIERIDESWHSNSAKTNEMILNPLNIHELVTH